MTSRALAGHNGEKRPGAAYQLTHNITPAEAATFDTAIFSEDRLSADGDVIPHPAIEPAYYERLMDHGGEIFGFTKEGRIAAFGAIALNADVRAEEPVVRYMDDASAYFLVLGVDPQDRGEGLAGAVIDHGIARARAAGKRRLITTVHPTNTPSLRAFLAEGF